MGLNQAVTRNNKTIEQELKDPNSLLSIDMNNAILNRDLLLRELEIQDFEYASYIAAKEKADEADSETAERRRAQQEAMLRRSSEEYYAEQKKIAEQAVTLGLTPLNPYDFLMTSIADSQLQMNMIAARLAEVKEQKKLAEAGYATAAADWKNQRVAYVDSYFDTVHQTSINLGGLPFSMDLNSAYGRALSPEQRQEFQANRQEARLRAKASAALLPSEILAQLPREHVIHALSHPESAASTRQEFIFEIHELAPLIYDMRTWVALHAQDEQRNLRETFQNQGGMNRVAKILMEQSRRHNAVRQARQAMEERSDRVASFQELKRKLEQEERQLEQMQMKVGANIQGILSRVSLFAVQQGHPHAVYLREVDQATQAAMHPESAFLRPGRGI